MQGKNQCVVHFTHSGWADDLKMFPHCSTKWAVFMLSLKDLLETGKGRPAPNDIPIIHCVRKDIVRAAPNVTLKDANGP